MDSQAVFAFFLAGIQSLVFNESGHGRTLGGKTCSNEGVRLD